MSQDGDGWTHCALGHRHWGRYGAAGLLLVAPGPLVLLQHRAPWSHHGGTWGIPGGALRAGESPVRGALREAAEETGLHPDDLTVTTEVVDDYGRWAYTTVLAAAAQALPVLCLDGESLELAWVPLEQVAQRDLHPGFAGSWPLHLSALRPA